MEHNEILDVRSLFLRPRPQDNAVTQRTTGPNRGTSTPEAAPRQGELWRWLALAALLFLVAESLWGAWIGTRRRTTS